VALSTGVANMGVAKPGYSYQTIRTSGHGLMEIECWERRKAATVWDAVGI